jgi:flavin-binding protein dodecin
MEESVYKFITVAGSSPESWEKAAAAVVREASKSLKDLRIAEVEEMDMQLDGGNIIAYRVKLRLSFRYHGKEEE